MSTPLWVSFLQRVDRVAHNAYRLEQILRDELLFAWLPPQSRSDITVGVYDDKGAFLPGGATFEKGLFDWEKELLDAPIVPRSGRVLLAGAGGGRELEALCAMGYEVTAFEPCATLVQGAARVAQDYPRATVVQGAYADLVDAVALGTGPLCAVVDKKPFDLVLLGWGSFTHITEPHEQTRILQTLTKLAPQAPVALSFYLRRASMESATGRSDRVRASVRRAMKLLGAAGELPPGLSYESQAGFVYCFTQEEFRQRALDAGYSVHLLGAGTFPHALLVPTR